MEFATSHHEVLKGTSAGEATHLRAVGVDVRVHMVVGMNPAESIEVALGRADIAFAASRLDGPRERHLNLMVPAGGRVPACLDVPATQDAGSPGASAAPGECGDRRPRHRAGLRGRREGAVREDLRSHFPPAIGPCTCEPLRV